MRLPKIPAVAIPNRPNTHPPKTPPMIPTIILMKSPKPPPLIILPAMNPATIPIIIYQIKYIRFKFRFYNYCRAAASSVIFKRNNSSNKLFK